MNACQSTPAHELERQIMDPNVPKNEREHWAAGEIGRLRGPAIEYLRGVTLGAMTRDDLEARGREGWILCAVEPDGTDCRYYTFCRRRPA